MHHALPRLTLLLAGMLALASTASVRADTTPDAAVLAPVHAFFDAMTRYDAPAMRAQVLPAGSATLMRHGKPVQLTLGAFVDHIKPGKDRIEERIADPQVRWDEDLAVVWAPYTFLLNGKAHHCGTDVFDLVRIDGQWKIAAIADNSRTCR